MKTDNRGQELLDRTFNFAVTTLKQLNGLPYNPMYASTYKQLSRSCASIGANYQEAQGAGSTKDFAHRISIVYRECRESNYWIRIVQDLHTDVDFSSLERESDELTRIFKVILLKSQGRYRSQ